MKLTLHFIVACLATFVLASIAHSQFVLAELIRVGVEVSLDDRISMTLSDLLGLLPGYGAIIALSLLLGFLIMQAVSKWLMPLPDYRFIIGGFLAICCALLAMYPIFNVTLIAGARSEAGILVQAVAGAVGGLVFMLLRRNASQ